MEKISGNVVENGHAEARSALIFLGTGCSSAVPNAVCLIQPSDPPCQVCFQSFSLPPDRNPNYRCNTSLLIDYCRSDGEHSYILIDVGKTFREQVLRWFTFHKIPRVDSIVLTHEHADAVLGLDDIRLVQPFSPTNDIAPTPIYLSQEAMDSFMIKAQQEAGISQLNITLALGTGNDTFVGVKFPYLIPKKLKEGQELRRVAQLEWKIIENDCQKPFVASGLELVPLPVMHGEDYVSLGFLFGEKCKVAYISDVSRILPTTEHYISKNSDQQLDLLILDTLYKGQLRAGPVDWTYSLTPIFKDEFITKGSHNTHFCFPQTLDAVKKLCPKRALLIGMTHEFDYHVDNEFLREWSKREGIPVQLARDGLRIPIDL